MQITHQPKALRDQITLFEVNVVIIGQSPVIRELKGSIHPQIVAIGMPRQLCGIEIVSEADVPVIRPLGSARLRLHQRAILHQIGIKEIVLGVREIVDVGAEPPG